MNPRLLVLCCTVLGGLCGLALPAPTAPPAPATADPAADPVVDAVSKFFADRESDRPPNEVTVKLPPPPAQPEPAAPVAAPPDVASPESTPAGSAPAPGPADTSPPTETEPSLTVQVEKLQTGTGAIDPNTVKLRAPFPAKPLAAIPSGWRLDASASAPPFTRKVDLAPGTSITLTIRPHLLVPEAAAFAISEPGFDPALGYRQAQTVSAILANSIQQLDEDAKQLGNAIDHLQQLVSSLPHPEPKPQLQPPATPNLPNKR